MKAKVMLAASVAALVMAACTATSPTAPSSAPGRPSADGTTNSGSTPDTTGRGPGMFGSGG